MRTIKLGTRGSNLALWQADFVAGILKKTTPDVDIQCKVIKTLGDELPAGSLPIIGEKGLFTSEIEKKLIDEDIDIAVHSLKDLPSQLAKGLRIGAVLKRENPLDALLSAKGYIFTTLPFKATLGTSSLRRTSQIKSIRPDINIEPIRGNIETRIEKMRGQGLDGIILAYAGVKRLGFDSIITEIISSDVILPAAGQGAIAVEVRKSDISTIELINKINDKNTYLEAAAERSFLKRIQGGCRAPVACMAKLNGNIIHLKGLVASIDGSKVIKSDITGEANNASVIGRDLAEKILKEGADKILDSIIT